MDIIKMRTRTHDQRVETLRMITERALHCDHCHAVGATLLAIFNSFVKDAGLSEEERRATYAELLPEDPTDEDHASMETLLASVRPDGDPKE